MATIVFDPGALTSTQAVLDWAGAAAAPAAYELAHAEALLTDWPHLDDADQVALRTRFRSSYEAAGGKPAVLTPYRVDARLRLLKHAEMEVARGDETALEARRNEHLQSLRTLDVL